MKNISNIFSRCISILVTAITIIAALSSSFSFSVNAQSTSSSPSSPSSTAAAIQLFTVRSLPFNNGNDARTFQDQLASITVQLSGAIANTSAIILAYNSSSQSQECWADVQECAQTFTWWFSGASALQNQDLFLAKRYDDDVCAKVLAVEVFRKGTSVPPKVQEDPSIMPFLILLVSIYGGCSFGSVLAMAIAYKIANK